LQGIQHQIHINAVNLKNIKCGCNRQFKKNWVQNILSSNLLCKNMITVFLSIIFSLVLWGCETSYIKGRTYAEGV